VPWYLIHTKPRQEHRALENLQRQDFRCVLPTVRVEKLRARRRVAVDEPLFARYLFVELDATVSWMPIRNTLGVSTLVRFGGAPAQVPTEVVEALAVDAKRRAEAGLEKRLFEPGEPVRILGGAFAGLEAVYQMPDGDQRALVLIEILSKPVHVPVAIDALMRVPAPV
jgi:transcriptional antiterminator RfaH